jgi:hypothetical protein
MAKFALRALLASLATGRSKPTDGVRAAMALLTLVLIVLVGLYIWSHGGY